MGERGPYKCFTTNMTLKEREEWFRRLGYESGCQTRATGESKYLNGAGRKKFGFVTDWQTIRKGYEWYHQGHVCGKIGRNER